MPKIFIALSTFAQEGLQPLQALEAGGLPFEINATGKRLTKKQVMGALGDFDGVVAGLEPYDAEVLNALPRLKCISRCGAGVDNVDAAVAKTKGIAVLNTPDVVVQPVAEMTLALMFDCLRQVAWHAALMRQGRWERAAGRQLAGKTAGIIGLGRIGRRVAELLVRLDVGVVGFDVAPDRSWAKLSGVKLLDLKGLLGCSDIVTLHLSADIKSPLCLSKDEFARMKPGALLINTSRGSFVDEEALAQVLRSGHLSGAGLDVYRQEPYNGPLCHVPNVVLTPHVSTLTKESRLAMETEAVENIVQYFKKKL